MLCMEFLSGAGQITICRVPFSACIDRFDGLNLIGSPCETRALYSARCDDPLSNQIERSLVNTYV